MVVPEQEKMGEMMEEPAESRRATRGAGVKKKQC